MLKIFFILFLFLISCGKKNLNVLPEKKQNESYNTNNSFHSKPETSPSLPSESYGDETEPDMDLLNLFAEDETKFAVNVDSSAVLNIITQIPIECINLVEERDVCGLKIQQISLKSAAVLADCDKNSIATAGELSDLAKNYPASIRGIFGDLAGISDVVNGTQKVVSGIIPKTFKVTEFRFEMPIMNLSNILFSSLLRYNSLYEISQSDSKISMSRRENSLGACQAISIENIGNNDPIIALGARKNLTALLFRKSDLDVVRLKFSNFNVEKFDELRLSAFINPSLEPDVKSAISFALHNKSEYKKLDYDLSLIPSESGHNSLNFDKDSIIIIYDKNNPIAYETAMISAKILKEKTKKKVVAVGDLGQKKLYSFAYDVVISASPRNVDFRYLSRKFFAKEMAEAEMNDLKYKIDLFYAKTYLCSQQKIIPKNSVSRLEVIKNDNFGD